MPSHIWCPFCHRPTVEYFSHEDNACGFYNTAKSNKAHIHAMCKACFKDWILKDTILPTIPFHTYKKKE